MTQNMNLALTTNNDFGFNLREVRHYVKPLKQAKTSYMLHFSLYDGTVIIKNNKAPKTVSPSMAPFA